MSASDLVILNSILTERRAQVAPEMGVDDFFELFCAQQVLRDYSVGIDDLQAGLVGGGNDGGIDGMFLFVDGVLVRDAENASSLKGKRHVDIDLVLVQATQEQGFHLPRILRIKDTASEIFDLSRPIENFTENPNEQLRNCVETFRITHEKLATSFPNFRVSFVYLSKGDAASISTGDTLDSKARAVESDMKAQLATIRECKFHFVGARGLIELATKAPKQTYRLRCKESVSSEGGGYISLVRLKDYFTFMANDNGDRIENLFESNVRDYQPDATVNAEIKASLDSKERLPDFWWLNNGVTIVASEVGGHLKTLNISDPQIVNGLQTSYEVFDYFKRNKEAAEQDERVVLVRIIGSTDGTVRDGVIRATNRQTSIKPASLWATDPIHRDLERVFPSAGLFYDRRKSYWQNHLVPLAKIVSITELAQAVIAIVLKQPDNSRGRPARFFSTPSLYKQVFNPKFPLDTYIACASIRKRVDSFMKSAVDDRAERNDLIYYVVMLAAYICAGSTRPRTTTLGAIRGEQMEEGTLRVALEIARAAYIDNGGDAVAAKSVAMRNSAKKFLGQHLAGLAKAKAKAAVNAD